MSGTSTMTSYPPLPSEHSFQQQNTPQHTFLQHYPDVPNAEGPRAPVPPGFFPPPPTETNLPQLPDRRGGAGRHNGELSRNANRLRKACDNCSIRKVKCDESGPPCKACFGLEIPCTFNRPSKRRGPPNRLAETIKKAKKEESSSTSMDHAVPSSPTHAAQALASLAQQQQVHSLDSICPWEVLRLLIDDYFTYIHPVIPIPHEDTYRRMLDSPASHDGKTFLALTAAMVACLTANYPRRPRLHLNTHNLQNMFTSSMSLIEKCQGVIEVAHGPHSYYRHSTLYDAIVNYLQAVTAFNTHYREPAIRYLKEALNTIISLKLHLSENVRRDREDGVPLSAPAPNGNHIPPSQRSGPNLVEQEMARRVFWLSFASVKSLEQLGVTPFSLCILPSTKSDPWPPLPAQVDDARILPTHFMYQSENIVSEMAGFAFNIKLFQSYEAVSTREMIHGPGALVDWEAQKKELADSLNRVKDILDSFPPHFQLGNGQIEYNLPNQAHMYPDPETGRLAENQMDVEISTFEERQAMMLGIQKANIHATQLGTRSYLVEKYFLLSDAYDEAQTHLSPGAATPGLRSSHHLDAFIIAEYSDIITSLLRMLSTINIIYMEPNGASLISKVRSIASTLLKMPEKRKASEIQRASLPDHTQQEYLNTFASALSKLEKTVIVTSDQNQDDEDTRLRQWGALRKVQMRTWNVEG